MSRRLLASIAFLAVVGSSAEPARAQGFEIGYTDIGATLGIGGIGSASMAFGGRFERGWKAVPDLGDGVIGLQIGADFYSWSSGGYSWSYIPIGATVNYHFNLENWKIDPFLGAGLGYSIISCEYPGFGSNLCSNSYVYFIGKAGIRYFLSEKLALYGDLGAGAALLNAGAMFRVR
jgi:hypothetical protein